MFKNVQILVQLLCKYIFQIVKKTKTKKNIKLPLFYFYVVSKYASMFTAVSMSSFKCFTWLWPPSMLLASELKLYSHPVSYLIYNHQYNNQPWIGSYKWATNVLPNCLYRSWLTKHSSPAVKRLRLHTNEGILGRDSLFILIFTTNRGLWVLCDTSKSSRTDIEASESIQCAGEDKVQKLKPRH